MKAVKYCDYQRCKNYKRRDRQLCYVHEKKLKSTSTLPMLLTMFTFMTIVLSMYVYVEDVNVYVNTTLSEYKRLVESREYDKYAYEIIDTFVSNVSEKCIELYNVLDEVIKN